MQKEKYDKDKQIKYHRSLYENSLKDKLERIKTTLYDLEKLILEANVFSDMPKFGLDLSRYPDEMKALVNTNYEILTNLHNFIERNTLEYQKVIDEWERFMNFPNLVTILIDGQQKYFYKDFFYKNQVGFHKELIEKIGYACIKNSMGSQIWIFPTERVYTGDLITYVDVYLVMFDITDKESFDEVDTLFNKAQSSFAENQDVIFGLVGLSPWNDDKQIISREQGRKKAREYNCSYTEITSRTDLFCLVLPDLIKKISQKL